MYTVPTVQPHGRRVGHWNWLLLGGWIAVHIAAGIAGGIMADLLREPLQTWSIWSWRTHAVVRSVLAFVLLCGPLLWLQAVIVRQIVPALPGWISASLLGGLGGAGVAVLLSVPILLGNADVPQLLASNLLISGGARGLCGIGIGLAQARVLRDTLSHAGWWVFGWALALSSTVVVQASGRTLGRGLSLNLLRATPVWCTTWDCRRRMWLMGAWGLTLAWVGLITGIVLIVWVRFQCPPSSPDSQAA